MFFDGYSVLLEVIFLGGKAQQSLPGTFLPGKGHKLEPKAANPAWRGERLRSDNTSEEFRAIYKGAKLDTYINELVYRSCC